MDDDDDGDGILDFLEVEPAEGADYDQFMILSEAPVYKEQLKLDVAYPDKDSDNDGIPDSLDDDDDNDGIPDYLDDNVDGDGIPDFQEESETTHEVSEKAEISTTQEKDTDGDGVPDSIDEDDDNDGIPDYLDAVSYTHLTLPTNREV